LSYILHVVALSDGVQVLKLRPTIEINKPVEMKKNIRRKAGQIKVKNTLIIEFGSLGCI